MSTQDAAASDALTPSFNNAEDCAAAPAVTDMRSFRECADSAVNGLAWPTIFLSLASFFGFCAVMGAAIAGALPYWVAMLLNVACLFVAYTGFHESVHRNFHGKREGYAWLNVVFGTALGYLMFYPYIVHAHIHLTHHAHTNDPDKDPDYWMSGHTFWQVAARGLTLIPHYILFTARTRSKQPGAACFFRRTAIEAAPPIIVFALLSALGHWQAAVITWLGSYVLGVAVLGVCFDWVVHHPHHDQSVFGGTRTFRARKGWRRTALNWLHLFQNYHIIHHLYPRAPFYKHEEIFERSEDFLRAQGAKIIDV